MDPSLKNYINEQRKKGVSNSQIKNSLINAGWPEEAVDNALSSNNKGPSLRYAMFVLFAVVILMSSVILYIGADFREAPVEEGRGPTQNTQTNELTPSICKSEIDAEKNECYLDLVSNNFDCTELDDLVERNFCFRALEQYYLRFA